MTGWAEVIGDPAGHSLSPAIHRFWLQALGMAGDYRATRVAAGDLASHLDARRRDPAWRGCNVTIPHKMAVLPLIDRIDPAAARIGAVNCIAAGPDGLAGYNSDVDGIAAALGQAERPVHRAVVIGAGGAARAAIDLLADRGAAITVLARDPAKAAGLATDWPGIVIAPLDDAARAFAGADAILNASPMGMAGVAVPDGLSGAMDAASPGTLLFDMVYAPLDTPLLNAARARGLPAADGLTMLIGQARRAFGLFFGQKPPAGDDMALRAVLTNGAAPQ